MSQIERKIYFNRKQSATEEYIRDSYMGPKAEKHFYTI